MWEQLWGQLTGVTAKPPDPFCFGLDSYLTIVVISVGVFAIFFAGVTWAITYVREGRLRGFGIWVGFVLPATIPLAMLAVAAGGVLLRSRLAWPQAFLPTAQSTDVVLTYLFAALVIAVIFPAVVVVNITREERQITIAGERTRQYYQTHPNPTPNPASPPRPTGSSTPQS